MHLIYCTFIFIFTTNCCAHQSLPAVLPQKTIRGANNRACPAANIIDQQKSTIRSILQYIVVPQLDRQFSKNGQCPCGGPGEWRQIGFLNMSNLDQQCPEAFQLHTFPVRGCGRVHINTSICESTSFPSNNKSYSHVCGRINAFQQGSTDAFNPSISTRKPSIEGVYLDGVSLTHGATGSRQHIWSFAAATYETGPIATICPCIDTEVYWPFRVPPFVGNNYFCATSNRGPGWEPIVYVNDTLWDGEGCSQNSTCCQFNNPPWFCTSLSESTTDDIEMRVCHDGPAEEEDLIISLAEIYVK